MTETTFIMWFALGFLAVCLGCMAVAALAMRIIEWMRGYD